MDDIDRILGAGDDAEPTLPGGVTEEQTLLVSKRVVKGAPVLFVYRDAPDGGDSGWTLLAGTEPDSYLEDAENFLERTVGWALDRDATLVSILGAPADSAFERESVGAEWAELEEED